MLKSFSQMIAAYSHFFWLAAKEIFGAKSKYGNVIEPG